MVACSDSNKNIQINSIYMYEAEEIFEKYNLSVYESYTVEDYSKIPDINNENLIVFYEMRGRQECEKIVMSLGYGNLLVRKVIKENEEDYLIGLDSEKEFYDVMLEYNKNGVKDE